LLLTIRSITRATTLFALAVLLLAGTATSASAQDDLPAKTTIMGGYSFMIDRSWDENLPYGLVAALAQRFNETASLVFEASGQRGKYGATDFSIERWAFLGGLKLQSTGGGEALLPFIQVLGGLSRQAGDVGIQNGWIIQGGGGIDLRFHERFALRAFADYRFLRESQQDREGKHGTNWNQYRFGGGLVIAIRK
jgi:hypothetical protein